MTAIYWPNSPTFNYPSPIGRIELSGSYLVWKKTRMAGLQSREGRMMIDSVVWAQHINVTDEVLPCRISDHELQTIAGRELGRRRVSTDKTIIVVCDHSTTLTTIQFTSRKP